MVFSVVGARFQSWVTESVKLRNEKLSGDRNLDLQLDPAVAKFFSLSTSISSKYLYKIDF